MAVSKDEDFKRLSLEDAIELLRNDHLYVDSEEQVYVAAMEWLNCDVIRHEQAAKLDFRYYFENKNSILLQIYFFLFATI